MTARQLVPAPIQPPAAVAAPEAIVRIDALGKRYPVRSGWRALLRHPVRRELATVLDAVSFEVRRGEFFGLLGPNGAGKTTLFKVLSTLVVPDSGRAWIARHEISRDPGAVRRLLTPVVPEERSLNWRLTASQNMAVYAALHGLRGTEGRRRTAELLEVVELDAAGEKLVAEFSSGMRQRLLLARALLARPRVLLLDEPTRSLDPISARRFRQFLRDEVVGRQDCTVLLATHNAEEAFELCDRVGVLHRGRLLATGAPDELARRFTEDRYRMLVRGAAAGLLSELQAREAVRVVAVHDTDEAGWTPVDLCIAGGPDGAARVLTDVTVRGAEVALLERVRFALADLIERIVNDDERIVDGDERIVADDERIVADDSARVSQ